jgi:hypothetical protein
MVPAENIVDQLANIPFLIQAVFDDNQFALRFPVFTTLGTFPGLINSSRRVFRRRAQQPSIGVQLESFSTWISNTVLCYWVR